MKDSREIQTIPSQAESSRQWLTEYLRTRAHLASSGSDFHCDPACSRPGCKNQDLQVPVSLVDLVAAALHRGESVSANYHGRYSLGLLSNERDDWIRTVSLRLKKPCPFLENDRCSIYPVRPLPCILFPEYLVQAGSLAENAGKDHFRDYLCLARPILLSPERAKVIAKLRWMWERERLISSFYLFHHGPCRLDFSNLKAELLQAATSLKEGESAERPEPRRLIPTQVLEHFFLERIAGCHPFAGVSEKIYHLNNPEGQAQFLQLLQDDRLMKKLKQAGDDRALVFRFVNGTMQAGRRSLIPTEYHFYG
jgi:Fe-S-cluster containining protein